MGSQLKDALLAVGLKPQARTGSNGSKRGGQSSQPRQGTVVPLDARHQAPRHKGLSRPSGSPVPPRQHQSPSKADFQQQQNPPTSVEPSPPYTSPVNARSPKRKAAVAPRSRLVLQGEFRPHPLFADDSSENVALLEMTHDGLGRQLAQAPEDATDLTMGIDFGTSATKVVIRDSYAANGTYPVPLNGLREGVAAFLLPSRVYKKDGVYSLTGGGTVQGNLKLGLLECKAKFPVTEFNDCCAFLALVIRRARGWLLSEHEDVYRQHELGWRFNLGIAASSYEQKAVVDTFRRLAWAAASLAGDPGAPEVTEAAADIWRKRSVPALSGGVLDPDVAPTVDMESVDVVPEVSAQLQGFMQSARWNWSDRPVMMLVDVGAGTVDSAIFHVRAKAGTTGILTFYACRVEANGVMNLHRDRVAWLQDLLPSVPENEPAQRFLQSISERTDRLRPIPESAEEYLGGYKLDLVGKSVDQKFLDQRYRREVAETINEAKVRKGLPLAQLQQIPLLLCGGGSRMPFYSDIGKVINRTPGWCVSVDTMRPPVPADLAESGWHQEDFDRISVAYGLSLAGHGDRSLGQIVRAMDVPDAARPRSEAAEDRYVSKDLM